MPFSTKIFIGNCLKKHQAPLIIIYNLKIDFMLLFGYIGMRFHNERE
jgi:hypothetical protein